MSRTPEKVIQYAKCLRLESDHRQSPTDDCGSPPPLRSDTAAARFTMILTVLATPGDLDQDLDIYGKALRLRRDGSDERHVASYPDAELAPGRESLRE